MRDVAKAVWEWRSEDDLRLLTTIAIAVGRSGIATPTVEPIFAAWRAAYPEDAMGPIGLALCWFRDGRRDDAIEILQREGVTAASRADQAESCLADLCAVDGRAPQFATVSRSFP